MEVLRMENSNGFGPFTAIPKDLPEHVHWLRYVDIPGSELSIAPKANLMKQYPHHMLDIPDANLGGENMGHLAMMLGSSWKVGTKDMRQFTHWFPRSSWNYFGKNGFHLSEYRVAPKFVKTGKYQVLFDASHAKLEKTETLTRKAI